MYERGVFIQQTNKSQLHAPWPKFVMRAIRQWGIYKMVGFQDSPWSIKVIRRPLRKWCLYFEKWLNFPIETSFERVAICKNEVHHSIERVLKYNR
jgi:hypothetical protein